MAGLIDLGITAMVDSASNLVNSLGNQIRGNQPVDLNKLAELEIALANLKAQSEKNVVDDRNSARILGGEYIKAGKRNIRQDILAYLSIVVLFVLIAADLLIAFYANMSDGKVQAVFALLNLITGNVMQMVNNVYGYDFGGSFGSEQKNGMINGLLDKFKGSKTD